MKIFNPDLAPSQFELPGAGETFNPGRGFEVNEAAPAMGPAGSGFEQAMKETIQRLNDTQNSADQAVARLASGQETNIHHTMLELEQADISLRMAMQVRSKVLDAYQEIMRMQL